MWADRFGRGEGVFKLVREGWEGDGRGVEGGFGDGLGLN